MKRSFDQLDQDFALIAGGGGAAAALKPGGGRIAMKFLFSAREMEAVDSTCLASIQQLTGAMIITNGADYPGTTPPLKELNISGGSSEVVLGAVIHVLAQILQEQGALTNGEEAVLPSEGRLKTVVPIKAAAGIIGRGGENIKQMRKLTGLHIHLDKSEIPPGGGDLAEQLVALSGSLAGIQAALPLLAEQVALYTSEPWFTAWSASSNAGTNVSGIQLELNGKGMKGGGKGSNPPPGSVTSGSGLAVSGEICQFFARAGWCKYGDACRHSHAGATGESTALSPAMAAQLAGLGLGTSLGAVQQSGVSGEQCQFFARAGWCKFGDTCRYTHASSGLGGGAAVPPPAAGGLASGEICQFFARAGWCKYGDACRHSHITGASSNTLAAATVGALGAMAGLGGLGTVMKPANPGDANPPTETQAGEVCQFFAKTGWCKYGDACRHIHASQTSDLDATLGALDMIAERGRALGLC